VSPPATIRLDLHLHSSASWDCLSPPRSLLDAALQRGLHRIAITDHNCLDVALAMHQEFPDQVIPGEEVRTGEGVDLIGLFLRREIPKGTPATEACRLIREDGGIVYLPHPFAPGKGGSGRLAEGLAPLVDVVEVFNARLHPGRLNKPAEALARAHGKLLGAGSDAHTLREMGGAWVEVPVHENEPEALLAALRRGKVHGRTAPRWVHIASTWAKLRKNLPFVPEPA
jgi:predicted metal-dependent phosphoesterase TrpH